MLALCYRHTVKNRNLRSGFRDRFPYRFKYSLGGIHELLHCDNCLIYNSNAFLVLN